MNTKLKDLYNLEVGCHRSNQARQVPAEYGQASRRLLIVGQQTYEWVDGESGDQVTWLMDGYATLTRLEHPTLPLHAYRTPHPKYLRLSGRWNTLAKLAQQISMNT